MKVSGAKTLLMGGQACVLYGAAEFSRDSDFAVFASTENLSALQGALNELQAKNIAVPPFELDYLQRGHAVHFRCQHPDCAGMRVDVMAKMRGVAPFEILWERRATFEIGESLYEVMDLADLVAAKKTQRSKDWPMLTRLLENHYFSNRDSPNREQIQFWFRELRTPQLLLELARDHPRHPTRREAAILALEDESEEEIEAALSTEQDEERELDRIYWAPLKKELEELRHQKRRR